MNQFDLNHDYLVSYYGEMVNETAEIFEAFLEDIPVELALLKEEMNKGAYIDSADRLHKICPSFSSVGIPQLTKLAQQSEEYLRQGNHQIASTVLANLNDTLIQYMPAIMKEYKRVKNFGTPV